MRKFTFAVSAAILATAGTAAYVASPAFAQMAKDHDATITWAQAKAKSDEMWAKLDVNKDGVLNQADRDAKAVEMFDKIDANHDGAISKDEFVAHHRTMMDGHKMGGHDMGGHDMGGQPGAPGMPPMAGMGHDGPDGDHAGREGHHGRGHGGMHGGMMGQMLMMADANKDGSITRAEFDAAAKAHFDKMDANHDGKITREERRAGFAAMHGRDGEPMRGPGGNMPPPPSDGE